VLTLTGNDDLIFPPKAVWQNDTIADIQAYLRHPTPHPPYAFTVWVPVALIVMALSSAGMIWLGHVYLYQRFMRG